MVDILRDTFSDAQREVTSTLDMIIRLTNQKQVGELEKMPLYGPKFTKFDDFDPLDRQDADVCRKAESDMINMCSEINFSYTDLKVDVFDRVAITTFVLNEEAKVDGTMLAVRARSTMVFVHDGTGWKIAHEHFSPFKSNP